VESGGIERAARQVAQHAVSRRGFVQGAGAVGLAAGIEALLPGYAFPQRSAGTTTPQLSLASVRPRSIDGVATYDLAIGETRLAIDGRRVTATTINGTVPGPLLRLREGQESILRVTNKLKEDTSVHWHGILVPPSMDGVPGVSFPGIRPGQTFEYRFPLKQYGTYWYHSHSGLQEQLGHYGPLIVEPAGGYPYKFDREYVIVLSDWTFDNPYSVLANLKKQGNYYNNQRRTVGDFFKDVSKNGFKAAFEDRTMWARMRMDPTDISDVTGMTYLFLMNGLAPDANWTGPFRPGERVLLRFINSAAGTIFDVRMPGLPMKVVQVSGQYVQPVETDEIRVSIAETYDVIVEPKSNQAYTVFAEAIDRSGYARGTLTPREGMTAPIPPRRKRVVLTMADMGMNMAGMDMSTTASAVSPTPAKDTAASMAGMAGMPAAGGDEDSQRIAIAGATWSTGLRAPGTLPNAIPHEPSAHGPGNSAVPMITQSRLAEAGHGLGSDGWRVLRYTELRALTARPDFKAPERELELHLTGNMERFMWSMDGISFADSEPIRFTHGERLRLTMVNDTMMNHPMHLHGMWMELENGHGNMIPRVHTVNVKPGERISLLITADAPGRWAFHCHVMYHMAVGMFRVVEVSGPETMSMPMGNQDE